MESLNTCQLLLKSHTDSVHSGHLVTSLGWTYSTSDHYTLIQVTDSKGGMRGAE